MNLLRVAGEPSVDLAVRQVASITFKQAAKRHWEPEKEGKQQHTLQKWQQQSPEALVRLHAAQQVCQVSSKCWLAGVLHGCFCAAVPRVLQLATACVKNCRVAPAARHARSARQLRM